MTGPQPVILVPRRNDYGKRDYLWKFCKKWWEQEFSDIPIFEGHHDEGIFNRSAAINTAARLATEARPDWNVAVIIDSDVLCHPPNVRQAIDMTLANNNLVVPFTIRHNLNENGSRRIVEEGYRGSWKPFIMVSYEKQHSAVIAVSRPLWEYAGGFDEEFKGWGYEDTAFWIMCESVSGKPSNSLPGEVWHLYHRPAPEATKDSASRIANEERRDQYRALKGNSEALLKLKQMPSRQTVLAEFLSGYPPEVPSNTVIPRILHRVVPKQTPNEVEDWWERFQQIHPGWQYMTHRDPHSPGQWPLVEEGLNRAANGAQLADLIRLEALWQYGGIYVDSDCEPYRSLEPLLGVPAFAAWEDSRAVCNAVMGAKPQHPAIRACIELALQEMSKGTWQAGPGVVTAIFPGREDVLLLPPGSFYPYHYSEKQRRDEDHRNKQPWSFMAHHWAGSWLPARKQRPVSTMLSRSKGRRLGHDY